jgi:flagellar FliJ protein
MTDLRTLGVLLAEHERQRDAALQEHRRAQYASDAASAQLEALQQYRGNYQQRWTAQFRVDGPMEVVHCYQGFAERLTLAIAQQAHTVTQTGEQLTQAQAVLQACETRCAAVRKLIERRQVQQRLAADRHDQKQTDEFASRAAWRRPAA